MKNYKLIIYRKVKNSLFDEKDIYLITTKDSFDEVWNQFSYVVSDILSIALDEIPLDNKVEENIFDNFKIKYLTTEFYTNKYGINPFN